MTDFFAIHSAALAVLPNRISFASRRAFCNDILAVSLGIRTACLIDGFALDNEHILPLMGKLRAISPHFENTIFVTIPDSQNVFFVNLDLLTQRRDGSNTLDSWTVYIALTTPPQKLLAAPPPLQTIVEFLIDLGSQSTALPACIAMPQTQTETIIPLTGYLLEYPVSYVPVNSDQPFLSKVELSIISCCLLSQLDEHLLIRFSCPISLAPKDLAKKVQERFKSRLEQNSAAPWSEVSIRTEAKTVDRVAL